VLAVVGDLVAPIRDAPRFDLITAVAPYVPTDEIAFLPADVQRYEPRLALDGGATGLGVVERIATLAAGLLAPGGWLLIELGGAQAAALAGTLPGFALDEGEPWFDEDGDLRGLMARR
jgi:release factor glutamine methyltransferase